MQERGSGGCPGTSSVFYDIPASSKPIDISKALEYISTLLAMDGRETEEKIAEKKGRDKKEERVKNRPPFVKDPATKQHFTIKELKDDLSGEYDVMYGSGWAQCVRVVEDDFQKCTDHLPFGMRLHRRVGEHC